MSRVNLRGKTTIFCALFFIIVLSVTSILAMTGVIAAMPDIIVDNTAATFVGSWPTSTYYSGYYGSNYQYNTPGTGTDACTWSFTIPTNGQYNVYAWWTSASNKASNAPYDVFTGTSSSNMVIKDQRSNGGSWQLLGTYTFSAGSRYVRLNDKANAEVVADAVRVEYVSPLPTPVNHTTLLAYYSEEVQIHSGQLIPITVNTSKPVLFTVFFSYYEFMEPGVSTAELTVRVPHATIPGLGVAYPVLYYTDEGPGIHHDTVTFGGDYIYILMDVSPENDLYELHIAYTIMIEGNEGTEVTVVRTSGDS